MSQTDRLYGLVGGAALKVPCRCATTANITLSALQTIDGVTVVDGDRVLVKNQTDQTQNGIWVADTGDWERSKDFDGNLDVVEGTLVTVVDGSVNSWSAWRVTTADPVEIESSNITFDAAFFNDAAMVYFIAAGTGAVQRTAQNKMRDIVSVKDYGALGDGVTDDTAAIQACIDAVAPLMDGTGTAATVWFPSGKYVISSTITVPPSVILQGDGAFAVTNATTGQGSIISQTHNGVGVRFTRTNGFAGSLWHNGGARNLTFSGPGAGSSVKLVELGDSSNVDTSHGAWCGFIRDCAFNYATTGYGIYAAHSQSWDIRNNVFTSVKFGIYYNTVVGGAVLDHNTFDNSALASGSAGCAIFMRPGSLGGSVGVTLTNNYAIGNDYGIWLCSIGGAIVTGNQIEGCYFNAIILTKYLFDQVTADGSGCYNNTVEGNTFINWNVTAPNTSAAIQVSYSPSNFIGKNCYQSPTGTTGFGIGVFDATTIGNLFVKPIMTGSNTTTLPFQLNNSVLAQNTILAENYLGLASTNVPSTSGYGAGELGRMWWDTGKLSIWASIAGGSQGTNRIRLDGNRSSTNEGATVDVTGATTVVIRNSGGQTVTAFTDNAVYPGKEVTFYADNDANTTFGAGLGTRGGLAYNLPQYANVTFCYISAGIGWSEKCRKD